MPHSVYPSGPKARIPPGACACSGRPFSNFSPTARPLCPAACGFSGPQGPAVQGGRCSARRPAGLRLIPSPRFPPSPGFAKGAFPLAAGVRGPRRPPASPLPCAQAPGSPLPRTHKQRTRRRQVLCLCSPFFHLRSLAAGHPAGNQVPKPQAQPAQAQRQRVHVSIAEKQAVV
mgnify:CR=1 FL=1